MKSSYYIFTITALINLGASQWTHFHQQVSESQDKDGERFALIIGLLLAEQQMH